ncbi:MAG: OPT family oligopeptide transporter, partial [Sporomusa sp.]
TLMICACGGCLGVLFTIPLRRAMIVNSDLPYPEGLAAAEILKVGSGGADGVKENGVKDIMAGGSLAAIVCVCTNGFQILSSGMNYWFTFGKFTSQLPLGFSSALLGAGYLIGIASGMAMLAGTILSWGVLVPYFASAIPPVFGQSASELASAIWVQKVRLVGAGTIGTAAIWTLMMLMKPIIEGMRISLQAMSRSEAGKSLHRMDIDLPPKTTAIVLGVIVIGLLGTFYSFIADAALSAGAAWGFVIAGVVVSIGMGFFVAAACGYMAGLIGTSASPISGIGILGIVISSLVVLAIGTSVSLFDTETGSRFAIALAIFMTSVIVSIAAISNDNLQDLKT